MTAKKQLSAQERKELILKELMDDINDNNSKSIFQIRDFGFEGEKLRYLLIASGSDLVAVQLNKPGCLFCRVPVEKCTQVANLFAEQSIGPSTEVRANDIII